MTTLTNDVIYNGSRGNDFKELVKSVLKIGNLKRRYIELLLNETNLLIYSKVFTNKTTDPINNYEMFEKLGDLTANKCIGFHMIRRFPFLDCPEGVKVLARLNINYGSKESFFDIAQRLGFWPFISASEEERNKNMRSLLEDVLEAFIGATEIILDNYLKSECFV